MNIISFFAISQCIKDIIDTTYWRRNQKKPERADSNFILGFPQTKKFYRDYIA